MALDYENVPDDATISVYVANLGRYAEGAIQGGWVTLPVSPDDLDRFLRDVVGIETDPRRAYDRSMRGERVYEEYAIHDYDVEGFLKRTGLRPGEYDDVNELNLLASVVARRVQEDGEGSIDAIEAAVKAGMVSDPIAVANLAMQADEIPYFPYGVDESVRYSSLEEKFGYAIIESGEDPEVSRILDGPLAAYFDVERYGRDMAMNSCDLYEDGYFDRSIGLPDTGMYTRRELAEYAGIGSNRPAEQFDISQLAVEGERVASYTLLMPDGSDRTGQCIVPADDANTDITTALRDTLRRIVDARQDAGDAEAVAARTMGAARFDPDGAPNDPVAVIDDGWALSGAVTSFTTPPAIMQPDMTVTATAGRAR